MTFLPLGSAPALSGGGWCIKAWECGRDDLDSLCISRSLWHVIQAPAHTPVQLCWCSPSVQPRPFTRNRTFHFAPEHTLYFWIFKVRLQQGLCITYVTPGEKKKKVFRTFSDFNHTLILLFSISGVKINEGRVPPCSLLPLHSQHLKLSQAEFSLLMKNPAADYIKVCLCFV